MLDYRHIFFDLDNTLWDFDKSSAMVFEKLFEIYHLIDYGIANAKIFHDIYMSYNNKLWELYRQGKIEKSFLKNERFKLPLADFGINNQNTAHNMGEDYTYYSPRFVALVPHAHEVLRYLKKNYHIHLITNGFIEVQYIKIKNSGLNQYIDTMALSEDIGIKKPDPRIFQYALNKADAKAQNSIMVGDDLYIDILPAKSVGMYQVFFNRKNFSHKEDITKEIKDLIELKDFL